MAKNENVTMPDVYLDNNATTQIDPAVFETMKPFLEAEYANPSSIHSFGSRIRKAVERAREQVAGLIGADPTEIVFTSSGTESDNTAIFSALDTNPGKTHVVTSTVEHPAVSGFLDSCERRGYRVSKVSVDQEGKIDLESVKKEIQEKTALLTFMYGNNETGVLFPIEKLAELSKENGILFHTDAVQAAGKVPIDLKNSQIDFLSISGHKLHAPKGIGALFVRRNIPFAPYLVGGHQEDGRRSGTENVASIVGFGKACEVAKEKLSKENTTAKLRDKLESEILKNCPQAVVNGDLENRLPNTSNISFRNLEGESILFHLDQLGISVSTGSACSSGLREPSKILKAMGHPPELTHGAIRFSLSRFNTEQEIDYVIQKVSDVVSSLKGFEVGGLGLEVKESLRDI